MSTLVPTVPVAQPPVAGYHIVQVFIDVDGGAVSLLVQARDAGGNVLSQTTVPVAVANAPARIAAILPTLYGDLKTALGVAGTVQ